MSTLELGLLISAAVCLALVLLFHFEARRGSRVIERARIRLDFIVLNAIHTFHATSQIFFKRVLKQSAHFVFHSFLAGVLKVVKIFERGLAYMIRTNKSLARTAAKETRERNKLEEIALHKIEVALTDAEKKKHKDNALKAK